eukprot:GCRY01000366.1.p1 GENE.GCRY01000366.1~~GCRY01000366.1.p1  ORF type:complete len:290 (+),score=34.37 GCRY01000366.1:107-871(+)
MDCKFFFSFAIFLAVFSVALGKTTNYDVCVDDGFNLNNAAEDSSKGLTWTDSLNFKYYFNFCNGTGDACTPNGDCCSDDVAICQIKNNVVSSRGKISSAQITKLDNGFRYIFNDGALCVPPGATFTENSNSSVEILCDEKADTAYVGDMDASIKCHPTFTVYTKFACADSVKNTTTTTDDGGLSGGSICLIFFFSGTFVYLVVGSVINLKVRGHSGAEILPNWGFWSDLPALVKDGFKFLVNSTCRRGSYSELP